MLTIFIYLVIMTFLLNKIRSGNIKSLIIKSFTTFDIIFSWLFVFSLYATISFIIIPNSFNNIINTINSNDLKTSAVIVVLILLYIISIISTVIYLKNNIKKIKDNNLPVIKTLLMHLILGISSNISIPVLFIITFVKSDDIPFDYNSVSNYNDDTNIDFSNIKSSYTDSLGKTEYKDNNGNIIMTSQSELSGDIVYTDNTGKQIGTGYIDSLGNNVIRNNNGKIISKTHTDILGKTTYSDESDNLIKESYTDSLGNTNYYDK